jgi:kynurenine formamidase
MPFRARVWTWFTGRPGDPQPVRPQTGGEYQAQWLVLDEHAGTHVDAPGHLVPPSGSGPPNGGLAGAVGVDQLPLLAGGWPSERR